MLPDRGAGADQRGKIRAFCLVDRSGDGDDDAATFTKSVGVSGKFYVIFLSASESISLV